MSVKRITLRAWAEAHFSPAPADKTLQRWARDCWIFPIPQKVPMQTNKMRVTCCFIT